MIKSVDIKNYKSISEEHIDLGRVNVFIGENGAGKSNILEAIALAGAASADKLDNEFLASRGIRVTPPIFMRSAFESEKAKEPISVRVTDRLDTRMEYILDNDNAPYSAWTHRITIENNPKSENFDSFSKFMSSYLETLEYDKKLDFLKNIIEQVKENIENSNENSKTKLKKGSKLTAKLTLNLDDEAASILLKARGVSLTDRKNLSEFIIYSPENSALRLFDREGQIEPLGINGEGLLKLLTVMSRSNENEAFNRIKKCLKLFGWFKGFEITSENGRDRMGICDGFLHESHSIFDQRSANEGFLFAAFYFTLFSSRLTPSFFAIDNIDAALNPKLCEKLMRTIVDLSKSNDKQVILTTHNPAILDGINLDDDEQRLFVISRARTGHTRVRRFKKPSNGIEDYPVRLSEAFLRGALGGLPKSF